MKARTLDELICDLNMAREDVTPGGAVQDDVCVAWKKIGNVLWQVRETRFLGTLISKRIMCNVMVKAGAEVAAVPLQACDELDRCDCPLEFLQRVPAKANDKNWRDRVWAWHEAQLTQELEKATVVQSWKMKVERV